MHIDVPDELMVERILSRGRESGASPHWPKKQKPAVFAGYVTWARSRSSCSAGRLDDNEKTAAKRIETFHRMGCPTLEARPARTAIQKGTRVLISLWDSLMFGRVLKRTVEYPPEHQRFP